uniref:Disks large-associated protein n=1 Tax=Cryptocotyle lingua TaxID=66766 RepID=A0A7U0TIF4_9TREM|nr:disks large-associated protein [Cryptocotyle lingua]
MADHVLPDAITTTASSESALRSEVLAFFTPSTPNLNSSLTPRTAIVEAAKPQTKTLTVTRENGNFATLGEPDCTGTSEPSLSSDAVGLGYYRLDRLDSVINPTVTAKLDRMAQQLGFHVPSKSYPVDYNGQSPDWDELDDNLSTPNSPKKTDFSVNHNHFDVNPSTVSRKRSVFSNFAKRFSIPRHKTTGTTTVVEQSGNTPLSKTSLTATPSNVKRSDSRPRRLRRWLSRHFWRTKSNQADIKKSEEPFASAEAILEGNNIPSSSDGFGEGDIRSDTELDDDSRRTRRSQVRTSLLDPDQARQCASLEELGDDSPLHTPSHQFIPPSARLLALKLDSHNGQPLDHSSPHSNRVLIPRSTLPPSLPQLKESTPPFALVRENSFHSTGDRTKGHVHFASGKTNGTESFRPGTRVSSSSVTKLSDPQRTAINQSGSLNAAPYTPSYLSISVAAFGYSGYTRHSLSSHNLATSRSPTTDISPMIGVPKANTLTSSKLTTGTSKEPVSVGTSKVVVLEARKPVRPLTHNGTEDLNSNDSKKRVLVGTSNVVLEAQKPIHVSTQNPASVRHGPDFESHLASISPCNGPDHRAAANNFDSNALRTVSPSSGPSSTEVTPSGVRLRRTRTRSSNESPDEQKDHWQRSSLIMIAVSHASPRPRVVSNLDKQLPLAEDDIPSSEATEASLTDGHPTDFHEAIVENGSSVFMNGVSHPTDQKTEATETKPNSAISQAPEMDGHYFLRQVALSETELTSLIERAEFDLSEDKALDEETAGLLRTSIGKARLLIAEKFAQFRGLCELNLQWGQNTQPAADGDAEVNHLYTSVEDLDGFWAIVRLQIDDVHRLFDQIEKIRSNGWKKPDEVDTGLFNSGQKKVKKTSNARRKQPSGPGSALRKKEDDIARMKARERLEAIKREMRAKQQTSPAGNDGAFLVV